MVSAEQAVADAKRRYYEAFAALDLEQMEQIWLHEDWVQCVHPGWELLLGWQEVRESWTRIFSSTQRVQMEIASVIVRIEGSVGWVACTEHVMSLFESGFDQAVVQATNLFVLRDGRWRMVAHHASPLLAQPETPLQ